jgi:hypothetical protein
MHHNRRWAGDRYRYLVANAIDAPPTNQHLTRDASGDIEEVSAMLFRRDSNQDQRQNAAADVSGRISGRNSDQQSAISSSVKGGGWGLNLTLISDAEA